MLFLWDTEIFRCYYCKEMFLVDNCTMSNRWFDVYVFDGIDKELLSKQLISCCHPTSVEDFVDVDFPSLKEISECIYDFSDEFEQ